MAMEKIGEGAEATIYTIDAFGKGMVVKTRNPKGYRIADLDSRIRRQRTKKEAKLIKRAMDCGINVPRLIAVGQNSIVMERIDGQLLKDIDITAEMVSSSGMLLAKLHNAGITHGDFTPANLMISGKKLYLIDLGLSDTVSSSEEKALDVLLMKRQLGKNLYKVFVESYSGLAKSADDVLARLSEIEARGRYQSRALG